MIHPCSSDGQYSCDLTFHKIWSELFGRIKPDDPDAIAGFQGVKEEIGGVAVGRQCNFKHGNAIVTTDKSKHKNENKGKSKTEYDCGRASENSAEARFGNSEHRFYLAVLLHSMIVKKSKAR